MSHGFQIVGLAQEPFEPLFDLNDEELLAQGAVRRLATESPGFPCRVSLEDARVGEEVLLLPYAHQSAATPYRASGPIFVRRGATLRVLAPGDVPPYVARRLISVRAYDADHMMVAASVCEGADTASEIGQHFARQDVAYLHLHNAKQGCYSCLVVRA
jgi:hypothetical protein